MRTLTGATSTLRLAHLSDVALVFVLLAPLVAADAPHGTADAKRVCDQPHGAAKAMGLKIPPSVLVRASHVIE
jgi:hypothetical protein